MCVSDTLNTQKKYFNIMFNRHQVIIYGYLASFSFFLMLYSTFVLMVIAASDKYIKNKPSSYLTCKDPRLITD